ncbi:hypothetical protein [Bacillus benzoevorans]|uniref:Uncharacterized protein n=1 Tax=Bacillus benzoevorans TaxID=1456 RepID=A0A7X0HTE2_9BACI|nr:hypothetical protein [Bacillus benzoevorans]MBB6446446.1 hypothetical protein [Bacillus benzoevorans]
MVDINKHAAKTGRMIKEDGTIVNIADKFSMELYGLSTDTKPTTGLIVGTTFFEIDTTNVYMWDGSTWRGI